MFDGMPRRVLKRERRESPSCLTFLTSRTTLPGVSIPASQGDPDQVLDALLEGVRSRVGPVLRDRARRGRPLLDRPLQEVVTAMAAPVPQTSAWDDAIGPFFDTAGVCALLGVSRQAVHQRVTSHRLLAVDTADGHRLYPAFQFGVDRRPLAGWERVLAQVPDAVIDGWSLASFLGSAPLPEMEGRSVAVWLEGGGDPDRAVLAVRRLASRWAA